MPITTAVTQLLGVTHPILLAPMDLVADGRLVAAVAAAGGFGILGGGYGNEKWLAEQLELLQASKSRFGVGFITWSMAKQPKLLDLALEHRPVAIMLSFGSPAAFVDRIKRAGAIVICQVQSITLAKEAVAAGADMEATEHHAGLSPSCLRSSMFSEDASRSSPQAELLMAADWRPPSCWVPQAC
jgi:nitronate monooxygenase